MKMKRALSGVAAMFAALAATAALTTTGGSPAQATQPIVPGADANGDGIVNYLQLDGFMPWGNQKDPVDLANGNNYGADVWQYQDYPIACNGNLNNRAFEALWVYPTERGTTPSLDANLGKIRAMLRSVTSIVAASADPGSPITSPADLKNHLAPRWVTVDGPSSGICHPKITKVAVPTATLRGPISGTWSYLRSHGYNEPNRKYLSLIEYKYIEADAGGKDWAGVDDGAGFADYADTTPNSDLNGSGQFSVASWDDGLGYDGRISETIAHEMTHALGAVLTPAPHRNPQNGAHPSDCYDLMCYGKSIGPGQNYLTACGSDGTPTDDEQFNSRKSYRLDCNDDDYFAPGAPYMVAADGSHYWNAANSAYLWTNPQPTVALAPTAVNFSGRIAD